MRKHENLESLNINFTDYKTRLSKKYLNRRKYQPETPGLVMSFIPGTVVELLVREGDQVSKGQELLVLEAMKMKNRILSHWEGTIRSVPVKPGDKLPKGALLLEIDVEMKG
ncbi:MAG: acetyl-CoA carboxylase biotin carboxyl carrier protein subunit [Bacteroidales bacterium]|jgi:biotin carboxyl carrier protein|nr:acetyl-CoA carboxylase biotin carboxyl carrier protein subunit [Bacteroidales bacterium]